MEGIIGQYGDSVKMKDRNGQRTGFEAFFLISWMFINKQKGGVICFL